MEMCSGEDRRASRQSILSLSISYIFHSKSISIPKDIHYLLDKITILILIYPRDTIKEEKRI